MPTQALWKKKRGSRGVAELCDLCELEGTEERIIPKSWDQTLAGSRLEPVGHRPKLILWVIVWLINHKVLFFTTRLCCSLPCVMTRTFKFTMVTFRTLWSPFRSWSFQRAETLSSIVSSCCWCQLVVTSFKLKKKGRSPGGGVVDLCILSELQSTRTE